MTFAITCSPAAGGEETVGSACSCGPASAGAAGSGGLPFSSTPADEATVRACAERGKRRERPMCASPSRLPGKLLQRGRIVARGRASSDLLRGCRPRRTFCGDVTRRSCHRQEPRAGPLPLVLLHHLPPSATRLPLLGAAGGAPRAAPRAARLRIGVAR